MDEAHSAQRTADAVAASMWARDRASKSLGMKIVAVSEGAAFLEMTVRDDMLNGFDLCHGGLVTTLADSAFAFACNSRGDMTVAAGLAVELLAPAKKGDVLTARAFEVSSQGRTGIYDITVTNQRGETVALVRGRAHKLKDQRVPISGVAR
ncbi:MAG TPA: hydroxyphenylacetyl-CoA thioesterase PaaI [Caldimonas sp.]|nr:hydroxyphenylacetyl-CoA thioesterase PaaI [Caldimonas sp.]